MKLNERDAQRVAQDAFNLVGTARALPAEHDAVFRIQEECGTQWVLRISRPEDGAGPALLQSALQAHLEGFEGIPRLRLSASDEPMTPVPLESGIGQARLSTWISGLPMSEVAPITEELITAMGSFLARMDLRLASFQPPSEASPPIDNWGLEDAPRVIAENLSHLQHQRLRHRAQQICDRAKAVIERKLRDLPRQWIHQDAHCDNFIAQIEPGRGAKLSGLIDFGDARHGLRIAEVAIASAYLVMGRKNPLGTLRTFIKAYSNESSIQENEIEVLFDLIQWRLAQSALLAAGHRAAGVTTPRAFVSEAPAWIALEILSRIHPDYARAAFRDACGYPATSNAKAFKAWVANPATPLVSVLPLNAEQVPTHIFDFSVTGEDGFLDAARVAVQRTLEDHGAHLGIGRYDEARLCYLSEAFTAPHEPHQLPEKRSIHLGIDLFMPAGTPVRTPLAATVESLQNNQAPGDYGPTVILRHEPTQGLRFWTLYGHLDPQCLDTLREGQSLNAGEAIATLGSHEVNGGWAPHLHFQVILDLLGRHGDFPGVAAPSERDLWCGICPDPSALLQLPRAARAPRPLSVEQLRAQRKAHLSGSLSLSYDHPLHIVRGQGAYLIDANGQSYLDTVNNVCHVGHSHPHVVGALKRQASLLTTNTRYLHEEILRYTERLASHFPDPLEVVFLVNSGSEANELALRIAWTVTANRDLLALEAGYHGNTQGLVDLSSYKHAGPGGKGPPAHVHVLPLPDGYRGLHRSNDHPDLGQAYAQHAIDCIQELQNSNHSPAAFIAESVLSCGGQIVLPDGYLQRIYSAVHKAGGLTIADEVQVGFGRVGSHWWGFQTQNVIPDIVTLGKPMGNGFPIAGVITTRAIADAFQTGMEYFNTFGGSPLASTVGNAVLDVLHQEDLLTNAKDRGHELLQGLQILKSQHQLIGDVRGLGLFAGFECVLDPVTKTPAPNHAHSIVQSLRHRGILASTDGPFHNVIKIKPPLVITESEITRYLESCDQILSQTTLRTPTN